MVSRIHAICIRLGRMADRCVNHDGQVSPETYLLIDEHDEKCLREAERLLTEYEVMKVEQAARNDRYRQQGKR
jgi:hypothetical protein